MQSFPSIVTNYYLLFFSSKFFIKSIKCSTSCDIMALYNDTLRPPTDLQKRMVSI